LKGSFEASAPEVTRQHERPLRVQGVPAATCAKKRTRSPSRRASILKKGLALHDFPSLKESCLI